MRAVMVQDVAGTFDYIAPEVILQGQASCKADIFSFGVVMWFVPGFNSLPALQTLVKNIVLRHLNMCFLHGVFVG
jgi:serine/threonine protein kinase